MGVILRKRGKWFHLDIWHNGRRIRKPLRTGDRKKALLIRHELESAILAGEWNVALSMDTSLERGFERFTTEYEPAHHAPSTRTYTKLCFSRFLEFMAARGRRQIAMDAVRKDDLEAFQLERSRTVTIRGGVTSPSTVNRDLRELSTVFKWAKSVGICRRNPAQGIRPLKGVKRMVQPLTSEEIRKLLAALDQPLADVAKLILNTGLRLGEALHLRREDVQLESKLLVVRSRPDYLIKDREEREIPLVAPAREVVRRAVLAARQEGLLFPTSTGLPVGNRNALRDLYLACRRARIRRISWYLLRHTFATAQARVLTPAELKSVMGHADIRTADKYYIHLNSRDCRLKNIAE